MDVETGRGAAPARKKVSDPGRLFLSSSVPKIRFSFVFVVVV